MAWNIEIEQTARRDLAKLDAQASRRVLKFLYERVRTLENPRSIGAALTGAALGNFWKYRVGDYRIVAEIKDKVLTVIIVRIGNRRDVYKNRK